MDVIKRRYRKMKQDVNDFNAGKCDDRIDQLDTEIDMYRFANYL